MRAVCVPCSIAHMGICRSQNPHVADCRLLSPTPGFVVVPLTRAALVRKATHAFTDILGRETTHLRVATLASLLLDRDQGHHC